jgi:Domain of unknown function (DUF4360)
MLPSIPLILLFSGLTLGAPQPQSLTPTRTTSFEGSNPPATGSPGLNFPDGASLQSIGYGGTGCPQNSIRYVNSLQYALTFNSFSATSDNNRENCQINFDISSGNGWQYAISQIQTKGHRHVDYTVSAAQRVTLYFTSDGSNQKQYTINFGGPIDGDYTFNYRIGDNDLLWSSCGGESNVNVNTEQTVGDGNGENVSVRSLQITGLEWRRC